jgi:predicted GIY-YIG superfamily endonuclease
MSKRRSKWLKSECQNEALKYIHRSYFKKGSYGAYQSALRNGWMDEICLHMTPLGNQYKRMIYRIIFPNNYCYIGLTNNFDRRIYEHLNKKGVVFLHKNKYNLIPKIEKITDYIDVEHAKILEEYWISKSNDEGYICLNTAKTGGLGSSCLKWTKEKCKEEALKFNSRNSFMINCHSAYNSARKNKWLDEICSHMLVKHKKYTKKECQIEALKYKSRGEFATKNYNMWSFLRKNKWLDETCSHMSLLYKTYTKEECQKEALKYKSRGEFKKNNHKIWQFSYKHEILNEICSHMKSLRNSWTKEECKIEFLKYKNLTEFSKKNHNVYEFARKRKWIDCLKNN